MGDEDDKIALPKKTKDFADEVKEDLKSVSEKALESRIEYIQGDTEFQLREKRLETRKTQPEHDNLSNKD